MNKWLFAPLAAVLLSACTGTGQKDARTLPATGNEAAIVGIWAMMPLRNGVANVVEYTADGKSRLHAFNCAEQNDRDVEVADYRFSADGQTLHLTSPLRDFDLQVLTLTPGLMKLAMSLEGLDLQFTYLKTDKIAPLCVLYEKPVVDARKQLPSQADDFVPSPAIPANANLDRYVGKWADDEGVVQIEVIKDATGNARLNHAPSENWRHLYNRVSWSGAELHYQSFAYSDKQSLFTHPYHKSMHPSILTPVADPEKIQHSFFIDQERFDYILNRVR